MTNDPKNSNSTAHSELNADRFKGKKVGEGTSSGSNMSSLKNEKSDNIKHLVFKVEGPNKSRASTIRAANSAAIIKRNFSAPEDNLCAIVNNPTALIESAISEGEIWRCARCGSLCGDPYSLSSNIAGIGCDCDALRITYWPYPNISRDTH